jgi:hypothetical protein
MLSKGQHNPMVVIAQELIVEVLRGSLPYDSLPTLTTIRDIKEPIISRR